MKTEVITMAFWFLMLGVDLILPLTMIGFGKFLRSHPPKKINSAFGYRTKRSMKNMDAWNFAHAYFGRLWFFFGCAMLPASVVPMLFFIGKDTETIGNAGVVICTIQLFLMFIPIFLTEHALKKQFENKNN